MLTTGSAKKKPTTCCNSQVLLAMPALCHSHLPLQLTRLLASTQLALNPASPVTALLSPFSVY